VLTILPRTGLHVNVAAVDSRLDFARELEERDAAVAGRLGELTRVGEEIDRIRARASAVEAFFAQLPAERRHLDVAVADAGAELARANAEAAAAEEALDRARKGDARVAAERTLASARAAARAGEERVSRTHDRRAALQQEAEQLEAEAGDLERAAAAAAAELERAPRVSPTAPPEPGLDGVLAWAARARAAVLVARGGLEGERERIVREANELASAALGEPLYATNVVSVRRRLEERLG
jgi:chromosome segregation ATPase